MMLRTFNWILFVTGVILLLGCEGNTTYEVLVANGTDSVIAVVAEPDYGLMTDTLLQPDASVIIYSWDKRGGTSTPTNPAWFLKSMKITGPDGDTLQKDYRLEESWDVFIEQRKKAPSDYFHRYTLHASEADFQ